MLLLTGISVSTYARGQWSERQAWKWEKEVGVIKGFNQPVAPYPDMPLEVLVIHFKSCFSEFCYWNSPRTAWQGSSRTMKS